MQPLQLVRIVWLGAVHLASGASPVPAGLDTASLLQRRLPGQDDPAALDEGSGDAENAQPATPSELRAIARDLNAKEPEQPSDFDHFFTEVVGPEDAADPFEIKEEMLESCPEMSDELLDRVEVLPFLTKEELLAARDWAFENETADDMFRKGKGREEASMEKPPWWVKPREKDPVEKPSWWKSPWWMPKAPWSNKQPAKPAKPAHGGSGWKTKQLGKMLSGSSGNSSNSTNASNVSKNPWPDWIPQSDTPFIPPTMAPYIPSWEIRLLIQIYMPWANDLVLPTQCNRLAPIRDVVLTACYKMKVSREDCLQNSLYTTGYFVVGQVNRDAQLIDISKRPLDIELGAENRTVITWIRL